MTDEKKPLADSEHDDTPMTRQKEAADVPGRQKYRSARPPGDYTEDFGAGGTIEHPVKGQTTDPKQEQDRGTDDGRTSPEDRPDPPRP